MIIFIVPHWHNEGERDMQIFAALRSTTVGVHLFLASAFFVTDYAVPYHL